MSAEQVETVFALKEVTFAYRQADPAVLRKLTAVIPAGKTTVIMGSSGAGKSTLLYLLGLLWEHGPSHAWQLREGSIGYCRQKGKPIVNYSDLAAEDRDFLRSHDFGFVLQTCYLLPHFTCAQNIAMPLALRGLSQPACRQRVETALLRIEKILAAKQAESGRGATECLTYSSSKATGSTRNEDMLGILDSFKIAGGQRQRAAVLRALIHEPKIIFADEPFSNLDPDNARQYLQILKDWKNGSSDGIASNGSAEVAVQRTLVMVCHDPRTAIEVGDYALFLYPRSRDRYEPDAYFTPLAGLTADQVETLITHPPAVLPHTDAAPVPAEPPVPDSRLPGLPNAQAFVRRWRFVGWFAWKDLSQHPKARSIALLLHVTMMGLVGLPTAYFGLIFGWEERETARLQKDPIARSLQLYAAPGPHAIIKTNDLRQLRAELEAQRVAVAGIFPAYELQLDWRDSRGKSVPASGRSLADGDPLLDSCAMLFTDDLAADGVWISEKLRHRLKAPWPPLRLRLRIGAMEVDVAARNVLAKDLPEDGGGFLIPEKMWDDLRERNTDPKWMDIVSGPVPEKWLHIKGLPDDVQKSLVDESIRPPHPAGQPREGERVWTFHAAAARRLSDWKALLNELREKMVAAGLGDAGNFVDRARGIRSEPDLHQEERPDYTWATVYVKDVRQLRQVAHVADGLLYGYNKDAIERVDRISQAVVMLSALLMVALAIFACLVFGNLYSIQKLRIMQKDAEIGWLKAMGLPNYWLGAIFLVQAGILWLGGLTGGVLLGTLTGQYIAHCLLPWVSTTEPFDCQWPLWFWILVILVPAAICLGATWRATCVGRTAPPSESLGSE